MGIIFEIFLAIIRFIFFGVEYVFAFIWGCILWIIHGGHKN